MSERDSGPGEVQQRSSSKRRDAAAVGVALGAAALTAAQADAATFTVTNLADAGAGSLRDAVGQANSAVGADTITFQAGLTGTITLTTGEMAINGDTTITGPGPAVLSVSGGDSSRIFSIPGPALTVSISGLTLTHGSATNGGAIDATSSSLALTNTAFVDNFATSAGGAVSIAFGELTVDGSTFTGNTGAAGGGAIAAEGTLVTVNDSQFSGNAAPDGGSGGAVSVRGRLSLDGAVMTGNTAALRGGAIDAYHAELNVQNSTIADNEAEYGGGIFVHNHYVSAIGNSTITGNSATGVGGGILADVAGYYYYYYGITDIYIGSLTIDRTTIAGNSAGSSGGGAFILAYLSTVEVTNSTISANEAPGSGGGLTLDAYYAGARIVNTTVSGNNAGVAPAPQGSGIDIRAYYDTEVELVHTTVTGNASGVFFDGYLGSLSVVSSILANNGTSDLESPATVFAAENVIEAPGTTSLSGGPNLTGIDPQLGPLQNNGGPTMTHLPAATSPAIDYAVSSTTPDDQRGLPRPSGAESDAGAVEVTPGTLRWVSTAVGVTEGAGSASGQVIRENGSDNAISVRYSTANGTAIAPGDFTAQVNAGPVTWASGDTAAKTVNLPIVNDADAEPAENFTVTLVNPTGGATIQPAPANTLTVTINDDDFTQFSFSSPTYSINENGGSLVVTVNRTNGTGPAATVQVNVAGGTAASGTDYTFAPVTLTWANGESGPKTFTIPVIDDAVSEPNETINLTLNVTAGGIAGTPASATVTIQDNDLAAIPTVNEIGRMMMIALSALAGLLALRRGKLFALFIAFFLVAGASPLSAADAHPWRKAAADQKKGGARDATRERVKGTIDTVTSSNGVTTIVLKQGKTISFPSAKLKIGKRGKKSDVQLAAGQEVSVKVLKNASGEVVRVRVRIL